MHPTKHFEKRKIKSSFYDERNLGNRYLTCWRVSCVAGVGRGQGNRRGSCADGSGPRSYTLCKYGMGLLNSLTPNRNLSMLQLNSPTPCINYAHFG